MIIELKHYILVEYKDIDQPRLEEKSIFRPADIRADLIRVLSPAFFFTLDPLIEGIEGSLEMQRGRQSNTSALCIH